MKPMPWLAAFVSFVLTATAQVVDIPDEEVVDIPDPGLEITIREELEKPEGDITMEDVKGLTELSVPAGSNLVVSGSTPIFSWCLNLTEIIKFTFYPNIRAASRTDNGNSFTFHAAAGNFTVQRSSNLQDWTDIGSIPITEDQIDDEIGISCNATFTAAIPFTDDTDLDTAFYRVMEQQVQGSTFNFSNVPLNPRPLIFDVDGITPLGPNSRVQFWAGPSADGLEPIGEPVPFLGGGLFNGGTRTVDSVPADGTTPTFMAIQWWIDDGDGGMIAECAAPIFQGIGGGYDLGDGELATPAILVNFEPLQILLCTPLP